MSPTSCLASLTKLTALEEMNLFDTRLGDETLAKIILALPNLTDVIRGDFLCDALEWIDYWVSLYETFHCLIFRWQFSHLCKFSYPIF